MKNFLLQIKRGDQRGMAILYAVITVAAVITIGASIVGIYQRQSLLVSSSEASSRAFYAADTALECALKWDNREEDEFADGASTIQCAGDNSVAVNSCSGDCDYTFELDDRGSASVCAEVVIDKDVPEPSYQQVVATGGSSVYDTTVNGTRYRVHVFYSSGTFSVSSGGQIEYLLIGGGGGGGNSGIGGGGGGGGGALAGSRIISSGSKTVTIGNGGAGGLGASPNDGKPGSPGGNTAVTHIGTAYGGGGGGGGTYAGASGGSGGGGSGYDGYSVAGSGTSGQGGSGGVRGDTAHGGGGGGAGPSAGSDSHMWVGGRGGTGRASSISGSSLRYGGGGGGGSYWWGHGGQGGSGGGGHGASNTWENPWSLTGCNVGGAGSNGYGGGGGGGAGRWDCTSPPYWYGGNGGSGVVIIRYPLFVPEVTDEPIPTKIEVRGRNTCEPNSRQAERALRTAY